MKSNVLFHVLLAAAAAVPLDMEGGSDGPFFPKIILLISDFICHVVL